MCVNVSSVGIRECPVANIKMAMFWPDEWKNTMTGSDMAPISSQPNNVEARDESVFIEAGSIEIFDPIFKS